MLTTRLKINVYISKYLVPSRVIYMHRHRPLTGTRGTVTHLVKIVSNSSAVFNSGIKTKIPYLILSIFLYGGGYEWLLISHRLTVGLREHWTSIRPNELNMLLVKVGVVWCPQHCWRFYTSALVSFAAFPPAWNDSHSSRFSIALAVTWHCFFIDRRWDKSSYFCWMSSSFCMLDSVRVPRASCIFYL